MAKIKVAVLFGGRAPEHEVSIITGIQIMNALNKNKYEVLPIYISKEGRWIIGDETFLKPDTFKDLGSIVSRNKTVLMSSDPQNKGLIFEHKGLSFRSSVIKDVDIFFPAFHGRYGEDGSIQGLFEMANVAFVGCDVQASAIGMDKVVSKKIAKSIGVPVLDDIWVQESFWKTSRKEILNDIKKKLGFPVFVKPARLGSSIGITKAHNLKELVNALDVGFFYDTKVMVEKSLENAKEVNISILGNNPYEVSVCEMPISSGEILSFEDKYIRKGKASKGMASAKRLIPAPIKKRTKEKIEEYAKNFFAEIGGQGIARIDFLVSSDENKIFLNEINTLPGSIAFYLWKEVGLTFDKLVDKMVQLGLERYKQKNKLVTTFKSNILAGFKGGIKGIKD